MKLLIALACQLCLMLALAVPTWGGITLQETPLGDTSAYDHVKSAIYSLDCRHLAFLGVKGDRQVVVRDGVEGKPYDWIMPDSLGAPKDLSHIAFLIQNGNEMSAVVDGQIAGSGYYFVGADHIEFSNDAKHYAFTARRGPASEGTALVNLDGKEGKTYPSATIVPTFSPDGNHLAYSVVVGPGKMCVVFDGKELPAYDAIAPQTIRFSPDSGRLAYVAVVGEKFLAIVDGQASKPYDHLRVAPYFSPDSKRVAYIAGTGSKLFVVSDLADGPQFDNFTEGSILFSPDSKHLAYAGRDGKSWKLLLDGKEQVSFDAIAGESIQFSPDASRLGCVGINNKQRFLWLDGKLSKSFDNILWPGPVFSPDSKRVVFAGARSQRLTVVENNAEGPLYDNVAELAFGPDSKHVVYRALSKGKAAVVFDGKESPLFDNTTPVAFSPGGSNYAYASLQGNQSSIYLDGQEVAKAFNGWVKSTKPAFSDENTVNFLMVRSKQFLRVTANIQK
jgi:Tol biopolymer transport system component